MSWENATVPVPQRTLVGFDRVHMAAGQTGHMTSIILAHQMAVWKNDQEGFVVEPGKYLISTFQTYLLLQNDHIILIFVRNHLPGTKNIFLAAI